MRYAGTERAQKAVQDAAMDPEAPARLVLLIGDRDATQVLHSGEWGQTNIAISLDATLSTVLPRRYDNEEVKLYAEVAGVLIPQMIGYLSMATTGENRASTELLSASHGALFTGDNAIRVEEELEFEGHSAEHIVRHAASLLPYNKTIVDQSSTDGIYTFAADTGFRPWEESGAILSRMGEQVPYLFFDTATGGFRAMNQSSPKRRATQNMRHYNAEDIPDWRPPNRTDLYYSGVVVYQESDQVDFEPVFAPVRYKHFSRSGSGKLRLGKGQIRYIPLADLSNTAEVTAAQMAYDEAGRLTKLTHTDELTLPSFDALIEKGDRFTVAEVFKDDEDTWDREWDCEVLSYRNPFDESLDTVVNYNAALSKEDRIDIPSLIVPTQIPSAAILQRLYGVEESDLFFAQSLSWITQEGDDLVFTETQDTVALSADGDELIIT